MLPEFTGAGSASYAWATARDAVYVVEFEATVTTTEGLRVPSVIDTTTVTIGAGSPIATPGGPYQGGITGGDFSPIQLAGNAPNSIELDTIGVEVTIEEWEWVFDKTIPYNQGLEFDGDDSVAPGALPIDTQNGLALSAWIKPETGNSTILSTTNDVFALGVDANGQPFFQTMTDAAQHTATSPISIVNDGTWHHAVGIYDGGMIHLYLNASLQESVAVDGTIQTDAGQITIGEGFAGRIDDVSIWERALSERERDALREGSLLSDFKLVGYWRFNEGRGTVVGNLKAGSNPSNLIGDPQWVAPNTTRST